MAISRRSIGEVPSEVVGERPPTALELALQHHRGPLIVLLILLPIVCWTWIVVMARDMYGPMTGASAWMMTPQWDVRYVLLLWMMWAVMMAGMMLPSASPMMLMYGLAARRQGSGATAGRQIYALVSGYVVVWTLFSVVAAVAQLTLSTQLVISPMMTLTSPRVGVSLLFLAGLYQLTPLKSVCLQKCQSPLAFLMHHWRAGVGGAFRMGIDHGMYCLGCCWALMLLLFVGGVMNLTVIAALTAFVAFEKLGPFGIHTARVSGLLLVGLGVWILATM
jgi:predicted metal-binding membrane protein